LTPENYHLLNHAAFDQMKNGVMVINTSRGALIDSQAAIEALKTDEQTKQFITMLQDQGAMHGWDLPTAQGASLQLKQMFARQQI
ncbi:hypothetical protein MJL79_31670, partial [Salmonella enterica subsp. enterica serovar Montevideo]|nr:hypothetical protein [Salmonella enterica subsp. enterica serovar Montevideo]